MSSFEYFVPTRKGVKALINLLDSLPASSANRALHFDISVSIKFLPASVIVKATFPVFGLAVSEFLHNQPALVYLEFLSQLGSIFYRFVINFTRNAT